METASQRPHCFCRRRPRQASILRLTLPSSRIWLWEGMYGGVLDKTVPYDRPATSGPGDQGSNGASKLPPRFPRSNSRGESEENGQDPGGGQQARRPPNKKLSFAGPQQESSDMPTQQLQ